MAFFLKKQEYLDYFKISRLRFNKNMIQILKTL